MKFKNCLSSPVLKILVICTFVVFTSCNGTRRISKFEKILGKQKKAELDYLISMFENETLPSHYPNLNTTQAYRQYLIDLTQGNWITHTEEGHDFFMTSNLRLDLYRVVDSVWLGKSKETFSTNYEDVIWARLKYTDQSGKLNEDTQSFEIRKNSEKNIDSLLNRYSGYIEMNYLSSYRKALKTVAEKNSFLYEYWGISNAAGFLEPGLVAKILLKENIDLENYFIRTVIVTQTVY